MSWINNVPQCDGNRRFICEKPVRRGRNMCEEEQPFQKNLRCAGRGNKNVLRGDCQLGGYLQFKVSTKADSWYGAQ